MTGVCFFISLISKAWWFTVSKALDKPIEHKFAVQPLEINLSTTLLTVFTA
jgi:hypothetical protein